MFPARPPSLHLSQLQHAFRSQPLSRARPTKLASPFRPQFASRTQNVQMRFQSDMSHEATIIHQPRRRVRRFFYYTIGGVVLFCAGLWVGTQPSAAFITTWLFSINTGKQLSGAESASAFVPPDAEAARINDRLNSSPFVQLLRNRTALVESRPHIRIPESIRPTNLTGGTLAGSRRLGVPPLVFNSLDGAHMAMVVYLGDQLCGHPGYVHGGMLATLMDEGLAWCCFPVLPNKIGMTAQLDIKYQRPVKASGYYVILASTKVVQGRKAWTEGGLYALEELEKEETAVSTLRNIAGALERDRTQDKEGAAEKSAEPWLTKLVASKGLFIEPRSGKYMRMAYNHA